MLVTNILLTGTVAYAGVKTLVTHHRRPNQVLETPPRKTPARSTSSQPDGTKVAEAKATTVVADRVTLRGPSLPDRRQRAAAATAVWLSVGGLIWSPLTLIGVPLTIYSSIAVFEAAGRSLYAEGKLRPSVINSILLVSTLATENYLPAAVISWLHHSFKQIGQRIEAASEQIAAEIEPEVVDLLRQAMGGSPQLVWVARNTAVDQGETSDQTADETAGEAQDIEMQIPFDELKVGDILVANRGEFIPINGVVTAGTATLNLLLLTRSGAPMTVGAGDRVYPGAFVTEGRLHIKIEQLQPK